MLYAYVQYDKKTEICAGVETRFHCQASWNERAVDRKQLPYLQVHRWHLRARGSLRHQCTEISSVSRPQQMLPDAVCHC